ncbi:MAG: acyl-CoA synthetase FdrA [Chloroflexi bacterium]|nr:acyl-CoA synthetase FdrA [Chloroflexota bacterium]MCI0576416.1 acyl-CoA synthetase FdrA [Chloroflexota bacterium]MCI0644288.1 acyl-CoA synthetase FdrA [Chloroflexota bacterium]MCI0726271.1 acyl-CoA synthetase FdrA [Chloroflexota bacterium]
MNVIQYQVRVGAYYDSIVLMQLQRALAGLPGVLDAGVVMATPANRELLAASGLLPEAAANPDDLLIVVKAGDAAAAKAALAQVDGLLARRRSSGEQAFRPRSLEVAVKLLPEARWVLVSVPGRYAAGVAGDALRLGRHVFLYSDNVALEDEIALKQSARGKGLLVMGPDCGTAIINGVGLGFANRVRRGPVGLVGASGTGLQGVTSAIHNQGGGISQAIGTGGRDLKARVGAITAHQALELLARDSNTRVIVLVSKPPAAEVAAGLLAAARATGKPVVVEFIGYPPPGRQVGNLHFATNLAEAAGLAVELAQGEHAPTTGTPPLAGCLRGLFSGGTLAYEAVLALQAVLAPLFSNTPLHESQRLPDPLYSQGHTILDLGEDIFTQGRLHPMMDNELRLRRLRQEAADPEVAVILLDVVLGEGAHPDPAAELAPAIAGVKAARPLEVVAVVVGTDQDPQELAGQVERLEAAGAVVFRDVTQAAQHVAQRLGQKIEQAAPAVDLEPFQAPLAAVNVGLESFHDSLVAQGAKAVQVEWRPPAGGNEKLMALLAKMKSNG